MTPDLRAASVPDPRNPHVSMWNTEAFFALNESARDHRVELRYNDASGRLVGSFVGALVDRRLVSGFSAPMGGIDFVRADEVPSNVIALVRSCLEQAAEGGADSIELRMKPPHHGAAEQHLSFALLTIGSQVSGADLSFYLDLAGAESSGRSLLVTRAAKAARRASEGGCAVRLLDANDEDGWAAAYAVLERNRVDKGRPMRLPIAYVRAIRDAFGPLVRMHVLEDASGSMLASALVYRTAARHDVVQYWGDVPGSVEVSPMPLLARDVFVAARASGADVVDLGISTDAGQPNHGLIQFKRSVGARTEVRMVLELDVHGALASPAWERLLG